jgi:penicillin-binding protein 2
MSIGQGDVLVTPVQMAASFLPIANGGKLLKPQMVQKIIDPQKNVIETTTVEVVRENFIDPYNLLIVREGMRHAITGEDAPQASAVSLNSLPVSAAAKTGTAETGRTAGGSYLFNNWITIFAPYDNPKIVLTILIKDVPGVRGATVPAAKQILDWYFTQGGGVGAQ